MENERTTTIRLPHTVYKVFRAVCASQGLRPQDIVTQFMRDYCRREGKRAAQALIANATNTGNAAS